MPATRRSGIRGRIAVALVATVAILTAQTEAAIADPVASWHVDDLGAPGERVVAAGSIGSVVVEDYPGAPQRPYVFHIVNYRQVYATWWDGGSWVWTPLGTPEDDVIYGVGAITVKDGPASQTRPYVFVHAQSGTLWTRSWTGTQWTGWVSLGEPPTGNIAQAVGVVAVQNTPESVQRPYVFVVDINGDLWLRWWDGANWQWSSQGAPEGVGFNNNHAPVGVANIRLMPTAPDYPQAFLLDQRGRMWRNGWDGTGWSWTDQGSPDPRTIEGLGVVTTQYGADGPSGPLVFAGAYDKVYALAYDKGQWNWSDHGAPNSNVVFLQRAGAITVRDKPGDPQRPYMFTFDLRGGLIYTNWLAGDTWNWSTQHGTDAYPSPGTAVAVQDGPALPQRPYVFYWSNASDTGLPGHLMVNWWG